MASDAIKSAPPRSRSSALFKDLEAAPEAVQIDGAGGQEGEAELAGPRRRRARLRRDPHQPATRHEQGGGAGEEVTEESGQLAGARATAHRRIRDDAAEARHR